MNPAFILIDRERHDAIGELQYLRGDSEVRWPDHADALERCYFRTWDQYRQVVQRFYE